MSAAQRSLRDRLGEAIRRSRIGLAEPLWEYLNDDMREDYRKSADRLLKLGETLDYEVEDRRG
jgi:hypothetical protein